MKITFVDVETTGLLRDTQARIVEMAFSTWEEGKQIRKCSTLIRGAEEIPLNITRINGITLEMLKDSPTFEEFWKENGEYFQGSILVAHNLAFDAGMINRELVLAERVPLGNRGIDTLPLSRKMLPELPSYRLGEIARHMGILNENPHRALGDLEALEKIMEKLLERGPGSFDEGIMGLFCLWGGYPSHRYFRDVVQFSIRKNRSLLVYTAPENGLREKVPVSIRPTGITASSVVGNLIDTETEILFDSMIEVSIEGYEAGRKDF